MTAERRAHVAAWGAVSGFGPGRDALVDGIWSGRRAVRERRRTASWPAPTTVAAEADVLDGVADGERAFRLARLAAEEALAGAPWRGSARRFGLVLASTKGELTGLTDDVGSTADGSHDSDEHGLGSPARLAARLARVLGVASEPVAVSCACASGLMAVALAARRIHAGIWDEALVVGVDALTPFVLAGFGSLHALDPGPCRPFDRSRRGVSLGDGAAAIRLTVDAARGRGAVVTGHGGANDACHVTGPDRDGRGVALAAERALAMAGVGAADVDVVHLHGTGTRANDECEARGLARVFGAATPPAFGTKAQTGHTLGAAGVLETGLVIAALERGDVPTNVGLDDPDVDPALDLVRAPRAIGRADAGRRALKVASGFGGIAAALVIET